MELNDSSVLFSFDDRVSIVRASCVNIVALPIQETENYPKLTSRGVEGVMANDDQENARRDYGYCSFSKFSVSFQEKN